MLASYEPNAELRLKRNDELLAQGRRRSPEVVFRQVKDAVSQAQMLECGAADIAMQIDPDTAKTLEGSARDGRAVPSFNFVYVALSPGSEGQHGQADAEVREAIALAIDRQALIDFTLGGAGRLIASPIPLGFPGGDGLTIPAYDPDSAKELLAKAGVGDGFTLQSIYPEPERLRRRLLADDAEGPAGSGEDRDRSSSSQPVTVRELARGTPTAISIPLTAVFFAPDFFGTSQYIDVFRP